MSDDRVDSPPPPDAAPAAEEESSPPPTPPPSPPAQPKRKPLPDHVWNGYCLFFAAVVLTITFMASNTVMSMFVVSGLLFVAYVALRMMTGRTAFPSVGILAKGKSGAKSFFYKSTTSEEDGRVEDADGEKLQAKSAKEVAASIRQAASGFAAAARETMPSDAAVDAAFFIGTVIIAAIAFASSRWYNMWTNALIAAGVCSCIYAAVRALTGRLRVVSAAENTEHHHPFWLVLLGLLLTATGMVLCVTEFGVVYERAYEGSLYRAVAPSALAVGVLDLGAALARPTRATHLVFAVVNAVLSGVVLAVSTLNGDFTHRSFVRDEYYENLLQNEGGFLTVPFLLVTNLRRICYPVMVSTGLAVALTLASSIVSFRRAGAAANKRHFKLVKILLGVLGLLLLGLCVFKIWCMSPAVAMPGVTDNWSGRDMIHTGSSVNSLACIWTALLAASYLGMRRVSKLEMVLVMLLAGTALASDYYTLSTFNPDHSLAELDKKLGNFTGCRGEGLEMDSFCYEVQLDNGERTRECMTSNSFCDGVIDIKQRTRALTNCSPQEFQPSRSRYDDDYYYGSAWNLIAADEAFCRRHYEQFAALWTVSTAGCMAVCGAVILLAAFVPTSEVVGKMRMRNQLSNWQVLANEETASTATATSERDRSEEKVIEP